MNSTLVRFNNSIRIDHLPSRAIQIGRKYIKKNLNSVKNLTNQADIALNHFDGLYSKVYGKCWPSIRLGLLSPKKHVAVLNSFVDTDQIQKNMNEHGAIDLARYYKKHLQSYTRMQLRQQIIDNKKARKREIMAKNQQVGVDTIDLNSIEVSDISDSELRGAYTTGASDNEGFSTAEDLQEMFSDRRMDEDERYYINRASTNLSLDDFMPTTELISHEESPDELSYYEGFKQDVDLNIEYKEEPSLEFNNQLKTYTFPRHNWSKFERPQVLPVSRLMPYYLLDGASILPILAMDLQMNDICADYCAAPGGKSLAILMTLRPKYLLCNDESRSRTTRISKIINLYAPDIKYLNSTLDISNNDASSLIYDNFFDKILVDVPCSNDRNSVETLENNIFSRQRIEERLRLPVNQCSILKAALKSLKVKGSVVYSTCTLSPIENDGVVQRALIQLREEGHSYKFAVVNLKEAFRPLRGLFRFNTKFNYGQQVLPSVCSNFGPMYISKIRRIG